MRNVIGCVLLISMLWAAAASADEATVPFERQVLDELRALREEVRNLSDKVARLEDELAREELTAYEVGEHVVEEEELGNGADRVKLKEITLPDNPSDEQVSEYINKILRVSNSQNRFSTEDPQVRMLAAVGSEHLKQLIEAHWQHGAQLYALEAIVRLAGDEHKPLIFERLLGKPELVAVIIENGWEEDARDILVQGLRECDRSTPQEWFEAVARLQDPSTYPALMECLSKSCNPAFLISTLRELPDFPIEEAVRETWNNAKDDEFGNRIDAAFIAADHGHIDALVALVEKDARDRLEYARYLHGESLQARLRRLTGQNGTVAEIQLWIEANKDGLVYDADLKQYIVKAK